MEQRSSKERRPGSPCASSMGLLAEGRDPRRKRLIRFSPTPPLTLPTYPTVRLCDYIASAEEGDYRLVTDLFPPSVLPKAVKTWKPTLRSSPTPHPKPPPALHRHRYSDNPIILYDIFSPFYYLFIGIRVCRRIILYCYSVSHNFVRVVQDR